MLERYLRLLDTESEGADWREVAKIVFQLDPTRVMFVPKDLALQLFFSFEMGAACSGLMGASPE
jgi:hypothetical protein